MIVAVDPPVTGHDGSDLCGIVAVALYRTGGPKIGVLLSWKMQACLRQALKYGPRPRQNVIIDTGPIALSQKSSKVAIWSKR